LRNNYSTFSQTFTYQKHDAGAADMSLFLDCNSELEEEQQFPWKNFENQQPSSGGNFTWYWYVNAAGDWVVVYENKTVEREMVTSWLREGVAWYGGALSAWSVLINVVLVVVHLAGLSRDRFRGHLVHPSFRWLVLNFTLVQLVLGSFVIPVNVVTDRRGGLFFVVLYATLCGFHLIVQSCCHAAALLGEEEALFSTHNTTLAELVKLS